MSRDMNASQAKQIQITDFLSKFNLEPAKTRNNDFWYLSPLHDEKTPSFKVDLQKNIWYDHALGVGGNIIDLVTQMYNLDFTSALQKLSELIGGDTKSFSFSQANPLPTPAPVTKTEIKKIQDIQNQALIDYLNKRKVKKYNNYLQEIYYTQNDKPYFALAFKNDSGGYETRNAYFKGCIGKKDITTIKGSQNENLSVFEGFIDYLSALTHYQIDSFKSDVIILNSVANKNIIIPLLNRYKKIYLFLDNDKAGNETKQALYLANQNCIDCSNIYINYKDFNEFLINN